MSRVFLIALLAFLTSDLAAQAAAPSHEPGSLDLFVMTVQALGGLALFLFGIDQMAAALKVVAGEPLRAVLAKLTTNRVSGVLTGALVTAIVQSSSVTTVVVVGFITADIMSLSQAVGVIFGANIGTTITAQIIAFKVTRYALLLIAAGFTMSFVARDDKYRKYGTVTMSLGLVFFGMGLMGDSMRPLHNYEPFLRLMVEMETPILAILVGALFTALIQSSSAATGVVIVLASQGFITLAAGIALAFGANIGTCVTALLASIGKPRKAVRAGLVHVCFNVLGVCSGWHSLIHWPSWWSGCHLRLKAHLSTGRRRQQPRGRLPTHILSLTWPMRSFCCRWLVYSHVSSNGWFRIGPSCGKGVAWEIDGAFRTSIPSSLKRRWWHSSRLEEKSR